VQGFLQNTLNILAFALLNHFPKGGKKKLAVLKKASFLYSGAALASLAVERTALPASAAGTGEEQGNNLPLAVGKSGAF